MPYKIVQTIENGEIKLTAVPEQWENEGILQYPHKKIEKFRKSEDSIPKESWIKMNCIVKRVNLTYREAEIELKNMCQTSDTETDLEEYLSKKKAKTNVLHENVNNFNQLAQQCLDNYIPDSEVNIEGQVVYVSQDAGTVQFSVPEIPPQKTPLRSECNLKALESKIELLTENVKLLSDNVIVTQNNQQELYKTQQDILFSLANITTQFEEFIKKMHVQPEVKENGVRFKRISDQESFDNFEKMLGNANMAKDLLKEMSAICGTHRGKGINNAYALIDVIFDRNFLKECSWAGGSRTDTSKICFKSRTNTQKFFFNVVNQADNNFTFIDTQKFFKVILRNSRQRCESQQQRTSVTKTKTPKSKLVQEVKLPHEEKRIDPKHTPTVSEQKPESLDTELPIQEIERGVINPEKSAPMSPKQPIEGQTDWAA